LINRRSQSPDPTLFPLGMQDADGVSEVPEILDNTELRMAVGD
jgi:hypothetical protein